MWNTDRDTRCILPGQTSQDSMVADKRNNLRCLCIDVRHHEVKGTQMLLPNMLQSIDMALVNIYVRIWWELHDLLFSRTPLMNWYIQLADMSTIHSQKKINLHLWQPMQPLVGEPHRVFLHLYLHALGKDRHTFSQTMWPLQRNTHHKWGRILIWPRAHH